MADNSYQFQRPPTVVTNNRINSQGVTPASTRGGSSLRYANIIKAGTALQIPAQGTQFYFRTATATISARPNGGVFSDYVQGEGLQLDLDNTFNLVEVKNNNSFDVIFELFIGFQGFIDNKLIIANQLYPQVAFPTYPTASAAATVDINDKSGSQFTDINGGKWYALSRVAIVISNTSAGTTVLVQKAGSAVANGPAIAAVFPMTSIRLDVSGNYRLNVGGGNIDCIVSEIYQSIPA